MYTSILYITYMYIGRHVYMYMYIYIYVYEDAHIIYIDTHMESFGPMEIERAATLSIKKVAAKHYRPAPSWKGPKRVPIR